MTHKTQKRMCTFGKHLENYGLADSKNLETNCRQPPAKEEKRRKRKKERKKERKKRKKERKKEKNLENRQRLLKAYIYDQGFFNPLYILSVFTVQRSTKFTGSLKDINCLISNFNSLAFVRVVCRFRQSGLLLVYFASIPIDFHDTH